MSWAQSFHSKTGEWWGPAESAIDETDLWRAALVSQLTKAESGVGSVLELGCGYGSTALAMANLGLNVTAIDFSDRIEVAIGRGNADNPRFLRADFFKADIGGTFDCVCYWDGFGVGDDDEQRRLLRRISDEWLAPGGVVVIEVYDPLWWSAQAGMEESKPARPGHGYAFSLGHKRDFDALTCRAVDSWWEIGSPEVWTQSLRCYAPADLSLLVVGTGLAVSLLRSSHSDETQDVEPDGAAPAYVAILGRA